ncbi:hypothetical protein N0V88_001286 [Collariella sp. IMI 366227]|nr:hypothetical protein N0V88_001286 [Collariella sp. IMI 366227]
MDTPRKKNIVIVARTRKPPSPPTENSVDNELPIQSTVSDGKAKDWEKLPKQDEKAAGMLKDSPLPSDLDWIDGRLVQYYEEMGVAGSTETAQVHPFHFTNALAELAKEKGVNIRLHAKVNKINSTKTDGVKSVEYEDRETGETFKIDGVTDVVVAAGPWTGALLPESKVEGLRAHSVVFEADVSPYAVFTEIQLPTNYVPGHRAGKRQKRRHKGNVDPEIYARPFGEVYACGETDSTTPLPSTADEVETDPSQCDDIIAYISTISPQLASAPIKARQACYLPRHIRNEEQTDPLNGPGTGHLMARMILGGKIEEDVKRLSLSQFEKTGS